MANQNLKDMELKEKMSPDRFKQVLHQWQEAAESNQEFQVSVRGQQFTIPADAINKAKLEVEYEIDDGEYELQLTMKWR